MAHSIIKIWIHAILGTKNHQPFINSSIEGSVHEIIREEIIKINCVLASINGTANHVHILFLLHPDKNIREVMHQIKGGSSYRINRSDLMQSRFSWQVGLGAYSVSQSRISSLKKYIKDQKEHHKKVTFEEEYQKFIRLHGLK